MTRRGALLFAAMCVIWGVPYVMIRVAVRELSPASLVFGRTILAVALLLPIAAVRGQIRPLFRVAIPVASFAAIEIAIPWLLLARAETKISSSIAGLLIAAVPLVGAAVVRVTGDRESFGRRRWLGLLIGLVGVAAIVGLDFGRVGVVPLSEIAAVAVCYAVGPIILVRYLADEPPLGVIAAALTLTAIVYAPFAIAQAPSSFPRSSVVLSVVGLGVLCTAVAFLLFFELIAEVGPVRATVITYVNPAVAALFGVAILSEKLTIGMAVGFVLVLAGSVLATGRTRSATEPVVVDGAERALA